MKSNEELTKIVEELEKRLRDAEWEITCLKHNPPQNPPYPTNPWIVWCGCRGKQ